MTSSHVLFRRGLGASGAASSITIASWFGEQTTTKASSRVFSSLQQQQITTPAYHRHFSGLLRRQQQQQQHQKCHQQRFSSSSSTTTKAASSAEPPLASAAAKAASEPTPPKKSLSFMEWYEGHLDRTPIKTKMVTGSILWGVGDAVAQIVPQLAASSTSSSSDEKDNDTKKSQSITYDFPRTGRAVFFGFALHAPTSHVHFNFLEWMTVKAGFSGLSIPIFKTIMEQFVYWSWISNSMYHFAMGALQGLSPNDCWKRVEDLLWDTQKAQWAFWIPVQLLNFRFVPVRHQLNVVLVTSIVWTALLSAWYPPVDDDDEATEAEADKKK